MNNLSPDSLPGNLFQVLFEKSPGSIVVKTDAPKFTILAVSDAYLKVTSVTRDQILGKGFFEVFPDDKDSPDDDTTARKVFTNVIETGEKMDVPVYRYDMFDTETNEKSVHYWSCSNVPISDTNNKVAYILNTVVDITGEVKAKEAAIESENRLLLAAEVSGMAIWDLEIKNSGFTYSPQFVDLFGHPPGTNISLMRVRNQVHRDDMENIVSAAYNEALITGNYFYEVRVFWPDNSLHWVRTKGKVLFDKKKQPVRMLGTMIDITENKRDEIRKNDFIAMASHELKTPLTSLKAYLQLLEDKLGGTIDPFVKTAVAKSGNQVNKMTALIHSFLDISRLEPGKLQLSPQDFDINQLIQEAVTESRLLSNTHTLIFKPEGTLNINADRQKTGQVISNFISNAIKYSPRNSTVTLNSEIGDGSIIVSVTDQGIGIKPKDQEKIFQRFYRAEEEELKSVSGFGIGLYLSSEIIQRHKGKIWVTSAESKGSTFYFSLPVQTTNP